MPTPTHDQLLSIQILRAVAACLVVLWHLELVRNGFADNHLPRPPQWLQFGYAGVELFFIISGYIIMHITDTRVFSFRQFAVKRFFRIYPIYAAFTLIPLMALVASPSLRKAGGASFSEMLASFAIFPQLQAPLLQPGWSLEHEIIFYLIVAVLLTLNSRKLIAPLLLGLAAIGVVAHGILPESGRADIWDWHIFSPFNFGFAVGALIHQCRDRIGVLGVKLPLVIGVALVCACAVVIAPYRVGAVWAANGMYLVIEAIGFTAAFALVFMAVLNYERAGKLNPRSPAVAFMVKVGDASYVLYLWNYVFLVVLWKVLMSAKLSEYLLLPAMIAAFVASVGGALALHAWIERPFLKRVARFGSPMRVAKATP